MDRCLLRAEEPFSLNHALRHQVPRGEPTKPTTGQFTQVKELAATQPLVPFLSLAVGKTCTACSLLHAQTGLTGTQV